jgi:antitoxin component of RelBE/YafQ-DinJ toxin-antitoxin module
MALKTFNLDEETYKEFSEHCKKEGISMSKKVENFIRQEVQNIKLPKKRRSTNLQTYNHPLSKYC